MRAFWLLVLVPLAIAGYLAVRVSTEGAELRRHELQGLLDGRLADVKSRASQAFAALERQLGDQLADAPAGADELRALARRIPLARQVFRLDARGRLTFPAGGADASRAEREFLERTASIWTGRAILDRAGPEEPQATTVRGPRSIDDAAAGEPAAARRGVPGIGDSLVDLATRQEHGWLAWYWAEGLHLLFWRRARDGGVIGAEIERVGVLARVVGALPTAALEDGRMELADSRGQTVHQWGPMLPAEGAPVPAPDASLALEPPLDSWQLRYAISPASRAALSGGPGTGLFLGLGAIGLAVIVLAVYLYREYTRRLRDAARRVGFVTRVSHELRTPLTNIRMYAELLEDASAGDEDGDQARRAKVIVAESQRLGRLIENVLAFARHQRGTLAVKPGRVDVDAVVREVVATFEPALGARGIEVKFALGAPPPVRASADAVEQIVANLLSNVEKYAAAGGEVRVATRAADGRVVVSVADRGPGVPARERDAIFEPFHRAGDSITGGERDRHRPGDRPRARARRTAASWPSPRRSRRLLRADPPHRRRPTMRVLIAEDDATMRDGLTEILEGEGYEVVAAADGAAALERWTDERTDFVLLDIMMPQRSGYDVCREIRRHDRDVPIVFLSAKSEEIDKVLGLELGADDFIMKPFGMRELVARVRAISRRCYQRSAPRRLGGVRDRRHRGGARGAARHAAERRRRRAQPARGQPARDVRRPPRRRARPRHAVPHAAGAAASTPTAARSTSTSRSCARRSSTTARRPRSSAPCAGPDIATRAEPRPRGGRASRATGAARGTSGSACASISVSACSSSSSRSRRAGRMSACGRARSWRPRRAARARTTSTYRPTGRPAATAWRSWRARRAGCRATSCSAPDRSSSRTARSATSPTTSAASPAAPR